jgi:hypothetical protein
MSQMGLGLVTPFETVRPYAPGDVLVRALNGERVVIESVERDAEAREPEVLVCVALNDGRSVILFPREIAYRSGR